MIRKFALISALSLAACAAPQNRLARTDAQSTHEAAEKPPRRCDGDGNVSVDDVPFRSIFGADRGSAVVVEASDNDAIVATTFDVADDQLAYVVVPPHIDLGPGEDAQITPSAIVYANVERNIALYRFPRQVVPAAPVVLRTQALSPGTHVAALGNLGNTHFDFVLGETSEPGGSLRFNEELPRDSYVLIDACGRLAGLADTSRVRPKAGHLIPAEWIAEALDAFHNPAPIESRVRETVLRFSEAASHDEYFAASLLLSRGAYWELGERFDSLVSSAEAKMTQARAEAHREAPELAGGSLEEELSRYGDQLSAEERFSLEVRGRALRPVNARRMFWAARMSRAAATAPRLRKVEVEGVSASGESGLRERTAVAKLRVEFDDGTVRREAVLLEEVAGRMLFATVERRWWLYEP